MIQRHLNRMRQLTNHGPGRSQDVTDMLTEDLLQADQQVEPVKKVAHFVGKRLASCMQGPAGSDMEKKLKKLALMSLSSAIAETMKEIDYDTTLRKILEMGCFVEGSLAQDLAEFEITVERDVLQPLNKLSEEELPAILKHRKQLQKLITDWNSAKSRLSQAQKNTSAGQGGGSAGMPPKLESLKEEEEELRRKLEQSKDDYLCDLYHFNTKEEECEKYFIKLLELQAEYHKKSLSRLTAALWELRDTLKEKAHMEQVPAEVYGVLLETHLARFNCEIAVPISACVRMLLTHGMQEEGLFRLTAGASILKKLKSSLGAGASSLSGFMSEPHAVAGALKSYLRELPEPLMTSELFDEWIKAGSIKEPERRLESFREVCSKLPKENYNNLRYLIKFMAKLAEHQEINKMTPSNIAIVLGPNLLWAKVDGDPTVLDMASASPILVVSVVEGLINCAADLFPEDVDFGVEETMPTAAVPLQSPTVPSPSPEVSPQSPATSTQKEVTLKSEETVSQASVSIASTERTADIRTSTQEPVPVKTAPPKPPPPVEEAIQTVNLAGGSPKSAARAKRPAPQRPSIPPPIQPRVPPNTETNPDNFSPRPTPRRITGGSLRVPNIPPPHPPQPSQSPTAKSDGSDTESTTKAPPPKPLPRNRIQSSDQ
ncbi:SH3 domain-binding protein 1 [Bombina bombina]|uniref:SH3 domain-binding protein 1 n=1 Tax=Bombina bombina TaxID=8345 RepID=UPI00235AED91|nr:SH3 domain-binding protein 1 [Bombina bombina]